MNAATPYDPYAYRPPRPLEHWLDPEAARFTNPLEATALRDMAGNFGIGRGLAAMLFVLGEAGIGFALLSRFAVPESPALWITAVGVALAFTAGALLLWKRTMGKLPGISPTSTFRSPTDTRSGLVLSAVLGLPICAAAYLVLAPLLAAGAAGIALFIGYYTVLVVAVLAVCFVPGHFIGSARRDFRTFITRNPQHLRDLSGLSLSWRDPIANRAFGPL